jgi:hypothetical protein
MKQDPVNPKEPTLEQQAYADGWQAGWKQGRNHLLRWILIVGILAIVGIGIVWLFLSMTVSITENSRILRGTR